jgi:hypothetical protein
MAFHIDSYTELVEIVHFNVRQMPGHRPTPVPPETRALLRRITRPLAAAETSEHPVEHLVVDVDRKVSPQFAG